MKIPSCIGAIRKAHDSWSSACGLAMELPPQAQYPVEKKRILAAMRSITAIMEAAEQMKNWGARAEALGAPDRLIDAAVLAVDIYEVAFLLDVNLECIRSGLKGSRGPKGGLTLSDLAGKSRDETHAKAQEFIANGSVRISRMVGKLDLLVDKFLILTNGF